MSEQLLEEIEKAKRLYYLAIKYENKTPKVLVEFSKKIINDYIKKAKEMGITSNKNIFK
ncbi:hypothetical protein ABG79_01036 [Caloramator mitchellensis]|uniref:Uncharacterized protein n=1 Tax=Caloramator mitchellensis TaxID=908809 RepID=A0A0R3JUP3_CALMK|nr:hypothetical protein [Caloramator mitchellensis]KRQ87233.1 hypothetical protein ABG79_01036 [Caloramator mitchellensis]